MKRNRILFLIMILPFIVYLCMAPAGASALWQATITPSATFIPPSVTPTAKLFDCPIGTPLGWGTYTPSPLWQTTCGACASIPTSTIEPTFTPSPVATWDGTGTPPATSTITPTATVTITPTATATPPYSGYAFEVLEAVYFERNESFIDDVTASISCVPSVGATGVYIVTCSGSLSGTNNSGIVEGGLAVEVELDAVSSPNTWYYESRIFNNYGFGTVHHRIRNNGGTIVSTGLEADGNYYDAATTLGGFSLEVFGYYNGAPFYTDFEIILSTTPIGSVVTPTPTMTPTVIPYQSTYCSSVAPEYDEFGFELFVDDGDPNCAIGWDEISIGDYTLPAVQICLQPSQFGVIRLFAVDFEVGIYGLMAAAAFFYRFFRTV
jgi:hypothetical protein